VKLSPFVTKKMQPTYGNYAHAPDGKGPQSPALYLSRWKAENGLD